jgi:hypothetical protein
LKKSGLQRDAKEAAWRLGLVVILFCSHEHPWQDFAGRILRQIGRPIPGADFFKRIRPEADVESLRISGRVPRSQSQQILMRT